MNLILLTLLSILHSYFVTVTEVVIKKESTEISIQFTAHDLEAVLQPLSSIEIKLDQHRPWQDSLVSKYIAGHLFVGGVNLHPYFIGGEYSLDETFNAFFEVPFAISSDTVLLENTLLIEQFEQQENVVNLKKGGSNQSISLNRHKTKGAIVIQ